MMFSRQARLASACVIVPAVIAAAAGRTAPAENEVEITVRGDMRFITSNGIPEHPTGRFPNRGNPNAIRPQSYTFR